MLAAYCYQLCYDVALIFFVSIFAVFKRFFIVS